MNFTNISDDIKRSLSHSIHLNRKKLLRNYLKYRHIMSHEVSEEGIKLIIDCITKENGEIDLPDFDKLKFSQSLFDKFIKSVKCKKHFYYQIVAKYKVNINTHDDIKEQNESEVLNYEPHVKDAINRIKNLYGLSHRSRVNLDYIKYSFETDWENRYLRILRILSLDYIDELKDLVTKSREHFMYMIDTYPRLLLCCPDDSKTSIYLSSILNVKFLPNRPHAYFNTLINEYIIKNNLPLYENLWKTSPKGFFIAIPKTASDSINRRFFSKCRFGHMLGKHYPVDKDKLYASCRNPYTRCISGYNFALNGGHYNNIDYVLIEYLFPTLSDWIKYGLCKTLVTHTGNNWSEIFDKQVSYVTDDNGCSIINKDNICRFENLEGDCIKLFGYGLDGCHENNSNSPKIDLDDDEKNKIYTLYKEDFDFFGYEK